MLFLYNTGTTTATVGIETYGLDGSTYINTAVDVPGPGMVRIAGDAVSTVSGTWSNAILVNLTTSSTYAKLIVPAGVKAEAYVAWNGGATYDPLVEVETLPIRFSTDPATLFLPTIE